MPRRRRRSAALGVDPGDYLEDVEREIVDGPHLPRSRWEEVAAILGASSKADQDQAGRLREALVLSGIEQVDKYLEVFLTDASTPRKSVVTKKLCDARPQIAQWFDAEAGRLDALIERRRALTTRDRTQRAAADRDRGGGELPPREAGTRPARLRRSDRQDAGDAGSRRVRLGALQARPRRRPCADRRGAGHQPAAMGHRRPHHFRIHLRRGRARRRRAHGVRGRRREAVDLFVPGRGAARVRRPPQIPAQEVRGRRAEIRSDLVHLFVPLRRRRSCNRSITCSATRRSTAAFMRSRPAIRSTIRSTTPGPA